MLLAACQSSPQPSRTAAECVPTLGYVHGGGKCLGIHVFGAEDAGPSPKLVVLLHGDISRGGPATYMIVRAEEVATQPGVIAVALIRPGYTGQDGKKSEGSYTGRRDHYTETNNRVVGEALSALRSHYKPSRMIVMGHSGGSAQTGAIVGRFPGVIDEAILVSCPCDIPRWRRERGTGDWPHSQSPIDFVGQIPTTTRITALTGTSDTNTKPGLAEDYVAAAQANGIQAEFKPVEGAAHSFKTLWPAVLPAIRAALGRDG